MRHILTLMFVGLALSTTPALAKSKGCPPGLAKKDPPCVPPGLAKKGVTADEWSRNRDDHDDDHDHDDDDDDDEVVYDDDDLPRYLVRPNGRVVDLEDPRTDGWQIVRGIDTDDRLPIYVIAPNGRIFAVESRTGDSWQLVRADDIVRLPQRDDGREFYLLDEEVVEIINREGEPYLRLLGALDDILN